MSSVHVGSRRARLERADGGTIALSQNLVLSGSTPLDWTDRERQRLLQSARAQHTARYRTGIVAATPGQHDVQANPQLSSESEVPYRIAEGCVWTGACTVGQVLGHYRNVYRPAPGSPLIDAGDPADGVGTAIGAVGPDDSNPVDLFGRLVPAAPPPDTQPPTVTLTAPSNGGTVSGVTTITATAFDNIGVAGVKFLIDGTQTGSSPRSMPPPVSCASAATTSGLARASRASSTSAHLQPRTFAGGDSGGHEHARRHTVTARTYA